MDIAELNALPPLRGAIIRLMLVEMRPVIMAEELQEAACVDSSRARAYLSILLSNNVVRACRDGFARGSRFEEWATSACRSRPRHSAHRASDRMHAIFCRAAESVRQLREARGWSQHELAHRAGVDETTVWRLESLRRRNIPFPALVLIAEALDTRIEVLTANC